MSLRLLSRLSRTQVLLAILAVIALGGAALLVLPHLDFAAIKSGFHRVATWCAQVNPLLFVLAFTVLPYVGVPTTLLCVVAAGAYLPAWHAVGWCWLGLLGNILLGYVLGHWLRGPITRFLGRRGWKLPEVPPGENWRLVLLVRIFPGPPLVTQNLLLAVAGIPLPVYLLFSLPVQMLFSLGLVLSSGALFHGQKGLLIAGVCLLVALTLLAHVAKSMYDARRRTPPDASAHPPA